MRETRIIHKWSDIMSKFYYYAQYKKWGLWWNISDYELDTWCNNFWYERSAMKAIDKFIANGYKQHDKVQDTSRTIIKYP